MKVLGQLESAQLEQLSADPAPGTRGRVIYNTTTNVPRMDTGTVYKTIALYGDTGLISQNSGAACLVDWSLGLNQLVVLTDNCLISFANPVPGAEHTLVVKQSPMATVGTVFQYIFNMDQDPQRSNYQPISALPLGNSGTYEWIYSPSIRDARSTISAVFPTPANGTNTALNCVVSPDGKTIAVGMATAPFTNFWSLFIGGKEPVEFGLINTTAPTAAVATTTGLAYSPDSNMIFLCSGTNPFIQGFYINNFNIIISAAIANPATLPAGAANCIATHPAGRHVIVGHATSPFMSAYPYNSAASAASPGFGVKLANPATLPAAAVTSVAFSPLGDYLATACQTTPFIRVYPFNANTGVIGVAAANPSTLPTGGPGFSNGKGIAWRPQGDFIAMVSTTAPCIFLYGFNRATGAFTTYETSIPVISGCTCVQWSTDGNYLMISGGLGGVNFTMYDFVNQNLVTIVGYDSAAVGATVRDVSVHPNGEVFFVTQGNTMQMFGMPTKSKSYLKLGK